MIRDKEHWDQFYSRWTMLVPSQFCVMVAQDLAPTTQVIEFGCGNGRDSFFFAHCGLRVLAIDASHSAIDHAASIETHNGIDITFKQADVGNLEQLSDAISEWRDPNSRTIFYARFFLHSIDEDTQNRLLRYTRQLMNSEDRLFLEFRTSQDAERPKEFGQHYRRYIDPDKFKAVLESLDLKVLYSVSGYGMAVFKEEDAHVARFVAAPTVDG